MGWWNFLKTWFFRGDSSSLKHAKIVDQLFSEDSDAWSDAEKNRVATHPADQIFEEEYRESLPEGRAVDSILAKKKSASELLNAVKAQCSRMKLIVGLGNPGSQYVGTRHNMGYEVLAELAKRFGKGRAKSKFQGEIMEGSIAGQNVIFLSPVTYMNLSGQSVQPCKDFYKVALPDVLVICDDIHLPVGKIRMRTQGSAGGQKGLADCIRALGTDNFTRLRVGVGEKPASWDLADYVLSKFSKPERELIDIAVQNAADAAELWVKEGADRCMTHYNV